MGERAAPLPTRASPIAANSARPGAVVATPTTPLAATSTLAAPPDASTVGARTSVDAATILPKDALGVTLLVVCAAMALDILAPWSESYTVRQSLVSRFGHPAYVVVGLALVAAVPLYRRDWRRTPFCAAAPLVVGALAVGVGITYYIFLARENAQVVSFQLTSSGGFTSAQSGGAQYATTSPATPISPQLGLYLFILLGAVMVVVGYQLFLAAVRSQYVLVTLPGPVAYAPGPAPILGAAPLAPLPHVAAVPVAGFPSPASVPLAPASVPLPAPVSLPVPALAFTPPAPMAPATPPVAMSPGVPPTPVPPAPMDGNGARPGLVLPGTDAWNQPPVSPAVNRQTRMRGGWRYSSR
ncbi:MAG TPA: hypothetical protein VJN88_01700 [Ktedonobacterales bacterium]|nr:hypothetical protein [Ktedonobacterales bacterium]